LYVGENESYLDPDIFILSVEETKPMKKKEYISGNIVIFYCCCASSLVNAAIMTSTYLAMTK